MLTLSGVAMDPALRADPLARLAPRRVARDAALPAARGRRPGCADMVAGIFKHSGLLGDLFRESRPAGARCSPPELEGLDISPTRCARCAAWHPTPFAAAGYTSEWAVHVPVEAVSGRFGTVSAHAATIVAMSLLAIRTIRRRWFYPPDGALRRGDLLLAHLPGEALPRGHPLGRRTRCPAGLGEPMPCGSASPAAAPGVNNCVFPHFFLFLRG